MSPIESQPSLRVSEEEMTRTWLALKMGDGDTGRVKETDPRAFRRNVALPTP